MTDACCGEHNCRRRQPILIRRAPFSGGWVAITRYKPLDGGIVEAQEKHTLTGPTQVEIELCGSVLKDLHAYVKDLYERAPNYSESESAYLDVLRKLAALAEAKETALIGPREEASR